jgi:hypothetical protein
MAREHEIKKLDFQISGYTNQEIEQLIHDIIPDVIETYFDKFDASGKEIFIDKIEFDLGTIRASNFAEEIKVRLSYLLQTEFKRFFDQPNIEQRIHEKAVITKTDAFINYIKKGYSNFEDQNLNELFQHLLDSNIATLRELMINRRDSPQSMQRIFYQVSYENLERYWRKVYPREYKQIHSIVEAILADAGQRWRRCRKGVCVCTCMRMCMCVYLCVFICVRTYVCECMHVRVCLCVHVCVYVPV